MGLPLLSQYMLKAASLLSDQQAYRLEKLGIENITHHINWSAGVLSGEVTIETADEVDYTGTWATLAVVAFSGTAPKQDYAATNLYVAAIRHRVSQPVLGGTVTTKMMASD